jgi:hypothetical protein
LIKFLFLIVHWLLMYFHQQIIQLFVLEFFSFRSAKSCAAATTSTL